MTEKEKMLLGKRYCASDDELTDDRLSARQFLYEINNLPPDEGVEIQTLFKELFKTKYDIFIEPPFRCDYGYNITVGSNVYANFNCIILDVNKVTIGDNVMLGPNVQVYTATHPTDAQERISGIEMGYPITIGNNVWIGGAAIICPRVTIGSNTTIGAGSVVTRNIPAKGL